MEGAATFFAVRLIAGIAGWCCFFSAPGHRVVSPLFRIQLLLVLGLAVVAGMAGPKGDAPWAIALGLSSFAGSVCWLLEARRAGRILILAVLGISLGWMVTLIPEWGTPVAGSLNVGGALASTATLGTTMCGMLLGHRYLTAPGMPLEPLCRANDALAWATGLRLVVSLAILAFASDKIANQILALWLVLRWLAGIVGLVVVWYMTRRILVYRNTQAATGVLFVGVILAFIGELTGDLLLRATGVPF